MLARCAAMSGALSNAGESSSLCKYIVLIYVYRHCLLVWRGVAPRGSAPGPKKDLKCPASQTFDSGLGPNLAKNTKGLIFCLIL